MPSASASGRSAGEQGAPGPAVSGRRGSRRTAPGLGPLPPGMPKGSRPGRREPFEDETEERRCQSARASAGRETDHVRLRPFLALRDLEIDPLTLFQGAVAVHLNRAVVDEYIRTTVDRDEAVPLLRVEPLDGALSHA